MLALSVSLTGAVLGGFGAVGLMVTLMLASGEWVVGSVVLSGPTVHCTVLFTTVVVQLPGEAVALLKVAPLTGRLFRTVKV